MRAITSHHHADWRNYSRSAAALVAAVVIAFLAVLAPAGSAHAAPAAPDSGKPWLGAVLEWGEDTAAGFSERLGAGPAVFGHDISIPYRDSERGDLDGFLQQAAAKGAHALLTVKPSVPLEQLGASQAEALAKQVRDMTSGFEGQLLIRFAPDMNASWVAWGQQPAAYRQAFQAVSKAFKESDGGRVTMVWAPYLGKDYPFDKNRNAPRPGSDGFALLDTNGDGTWNGSDSAYAPYYPGDDAVDWVGLAAYHDDTAGGAAVNTVPRAGELQEMLTSSGNENFYGTYSEGLKKPFLLQTAAFYSPSTGGASEADIKTGWWGQVVGTSTSPDFVRTAAVVWDERTSTRDTGVASISWLLTGNPEIAKAALDRVKASPMVTGPVIDAASSSPYVRANTLSGAAAWTIAAAMVVLLVALWQVPRRITAAAGWSYQDPSARDCAWTCCAAWPLSSWWSTTWAWPRCSSC